MITLQAEPPPLWTRDYWLVWLTSLFVASSFFILLSTMPAFAVQVLGADTAQVGLVLGIYSISAVVVRPVAGYALDSLGRRAVYIGALASFALLLLSYSLVHSVGLLLVVRLLHGASWGFNTTSGGTVVADVVPARRRGEGIGYYGLTMTLGMALGPWLGSMLVAGGRFRVSFLVTGALGLLAVAAAWCVRYPRVPLAPRSLSWSVVFERRVVPVAVTGMLVAFALGSVFTFISLYAMEIGVAYSLFFLAYAVGMGCSRPWAGRQVDRQGPMPVLTGGLLASACGLTLLALSRGTGTFLVAAALMGLGFGSVQPTALTMVANLVPPHQRGVATATFFSALDVGVGVGSILLGWVASVTSLRAMYAMVAGMPVLALGYALFFLASYYRRCQQPGND